MTELIQPLSGVTLGGLVLAIGLALSFEFVNGFHDTANAVATVIYTNSLKPAVAVIWSGIWNLIGVLTSTGVVAFSVVALLPVELVLNVGTGAGFSMVFALLVAAIVWNLGTWYLGLPASSSHTLIGAIFGVGLTHALLGGSWREGLNWEQALEVLTSLLTSPIIGFCGAALLLLVAKTLLPQPQLYEAPATDQPPPLWVRALLILTCTGVSFAHGSNDGQKGMGLLMLILVGLLPGFYALNLNLAAPELNALTQQSRTIEAALTSVNSNQLPIQLSTQQASQELFRFIKTAEDKNEVTLSATAVVEQQIGDRLTNSPDLNSLAAADRSQLRRDIYLISKSLAKLDRLEQLPVTLTPDLLKAHQQQLSHLTQFIPIWVKIAVALALGLGTMIGWKRIVTTVGEKIGKEHLTYAQGASAELVAMGTIIAADQIGLPVSTTHILSSGVAGTMTANGSGIQAATVKSILLAWVLTLPACTMLGGLFFSLGLAIVHLLGLE